jgi:hypothetical protein
MWDGRLQVIYHYHLTRDYPYTVSCFKGAPIAVGPGPGARPPPPFGGPPGPPPFGGPPPR